MAYDAARGEAVLFGGGFLNDTWVWDGAGVETSNCPASLSATSAPR